MNIFIQEMKMSFKTRLSWLVGLLVFIGLFMAMFPAMAKAAGTLQAVLDKFPAAFVTALGLANYDLGNILGYYGFLSVYILLFLAIFAMKMGMGIISEEIRVKASDFLLTKPVSRLAILSWKALCAFANITIVSLVFSVVTYFICLVMSSKGVDTKIYVLISLIFFLVQLFFMTFGMMMGSFLKKVKTLLPPVMGMVFGFYAIQFLSQSFPDAHLAYLTPFAYFDIAKIISTGMLDMQFLYLDLGVSIVFIALAFIKYIKKDMPSV
ncbi:MAG: ABC transporter permease subunit [Clostridia bacterium]